MTRFIVRLGVVAATLAITIGGAAFVAPRPAVAESCVGVNDYTVVSVEFSHLRQRISMDSCAAREFNNVQNDRINVIGIISLFLAKWPATSIIAGGFALDEYLSKRTIEDCARPGRGITFLAVDNVVKECAPQP